MEVGIGSALGGVWRSRWSALASAVRSQPAAEAKGS